MPRLSTLLPAAAVIGGFALSAASANAAVINLGYQRVGIDAAITTFATDSTGNAQGSAVAGTSTITANAQGEPTVASPNLFSNSIAVRQDTGTTSYTLNVYVTETGVSTVVPTYTVNFVDSMLSTLPLTESVYVSASNAAYALTSLIATQNTSIGMNNLVSASAPAGLTSPYSITFQYSIAVPAGAANTVNANINETGVVPEPLSISLFGMGLVGLVALRRRKSSSASFLAAAA